MAKALWRQMFAYDVDGDGKNDVITSEMPMAMDFTGSKILITGISRSKQLWVAWCSITNLKSAFSQLHALEVVDMDGDGLKDITVNYWAHGPEGVLFLIRP